MSEINNQYDLDSKWAEVVLNNMTVSIFIYL